MKSTFKLLALSLLAAGFLSACPKGEEPKEEPKKEVVKEEPKEEPKKEVVKEEPKEEPAAKVDEAMYLKAAFETTCVKAHVNDAEKLKETLTEVYARYGFDEAKFGAAEKSMADNASTKTALTEKMKLCTKEIAGQLKEKSSEDLLKAAVKDEKDPKKDPKDDHKHTPKTNLAGRYSSAVNAVGFAGAKVGLTVNKDNSVLCSFKGKREGKLFNYVLRGKVQKNGAFSANKKGVKVSGSIKKGIASGSLSGSINKKAFKARFNAKK